MLVTLNIKDFALIERLTLDLEPGLNVFTGETGAGKSLIIQAFSLLLGERASSEVVRRGKKRAAIEATFDIGHDNGAANILESHGLPSHDGEGRILVSRTISQDARSNRCFVNGSLSPLGALKELGDGLVDLHGQHDHQRLLRTAEHLLVLDEFGSDSIEKIRAEVVAAISQLRSFEKEVRNLQEKERERAIERDNLQFQFDEISAISPREDEEDTLDSRHRILANAEKLRGLLTSLEELLTGDDGVVDGLRQGWSKLDEICDIDLTLDKSRTSYHEAVYLLEEVAAELSRSSEEVDLDGEELQEVEERMGELSRLTRKYGPRLKDVLKYQEELETRLQSMNDDEKTLSEADERLAKMRQQLQNLLPKLTKARQKAARKLEKAVIEQLKHLGMGPAKFSVKLWHDEPRQDDLAIELPSGKVRVFSEGADRVEFLISTNEGEEQASLAKVASGGEVSRVMLALKAALASRDKVPIMVFDEIDTGIGGETAWNVAQKLQEVSRNCQCLCITHLPQIAACARGHFRVEKSGQGGRTVINVAPLEEEERVSELTRMLGGSSEKAREHAKELLQRANGRGEKK